MDGRVELRLLTGERGEMAELQRVLEGVPDYAQRVTGVPPGAADAQSTFTILPEGKGDEDKFVFGICEGGRMVGCADVMRGWPDAATAMIGLLLIEEAHRGRGLGAKAYRALEGIIRGWGTCARIRLGVAPATSGTGTTP